jgi:amino acid adenylation domain-containing protein
MSPTETHSSTHTAVARNLSDLFSEQVKRSPTRIALVASEEKFSYQELDERANQLGSYLLSQGVGPESLVGVLLDRKPEMLIAVLAILRAGAAYVPLDPAYPAERIGYIVEDAEISFILSSNRLPHSPVGVRGSSRFVALEEIAWSESQEVTSKARPENLAYVIYTSGSTGRPKGVMVEQRNVISFFRAMDELIGGEPGVWLAVTSLSFDISVLELLWTLTRGFTVVLHGDEGTHTIAEEIRRFGVTHLQSTPSLARMLTLDPRSLSALASLKKFLLGGEALPPSLVQVIRSMFHGQLFNMYGPTETTIWSTACPIEGTPSNIPIGKPLANTVVQILDESFQPVPAGEMGELYIGGEGVARGYWKRPELTAERFLENLVPGVGRLYRTGDIARYAPQGDLEFLGRSDFQVKLSGFRIELGEIESCLEGQESVHQAVVIARENPLGDKRLVAYVVPKPGTNPSSSALRNALSGMMPLYMVPANFVFLDRFPLTSNGKIDRRALPPRVDLGIHEGDPISRPESELENTVAAIWAEALGLERIGVEQNFFDLGASSLMVAEVHSRLQQQLQKEISLIDLFQFPTVHALSTHLSGAVSVPIVSDRARRRLAARSGEEGK